MKAIFLHSEDERKELEVVEKNIRDLIKEVPCKERWEVNERRRGYAHYRFYVKPSQKLLAAVGRPLTEDEVIILVDGGFSHFGADCTYNKDSGTYSGRVNTD